MLVAERGTPFSRFSGQAPQGMGTTAFGFRTGARWEFCYQTWVQNAAQPFSVQSAKRFS